VDTADVHYAAAHYNDPAKAQFTDFHPFWEFVAGPLNAGTGGPGEMDDTFGPQIKFVSVPKV
jgi:alkaline phosphatase D